MKKEMAKKALSLNLHPKGPYRFVNREYFIITYRTDMDKLRLVVPEPLEIKEPLVKYEFIRMPDSYGLGDYTESGQVIPVYFKGRAGNFVHSMYLDADTAISLGREIWGFPKRYGKPVLRTEVETLVGKLDVGSINVATGTMGYKYESVDLKAKNLEEPNFLLKNIPDVDGKGKVCQLVRYHLKDIEVQGAWRGPAALELHAHALAPVATLPILEVISGIHFIANLTLGMGEVVYDYLK
jgi:acetoacetate decarboxylase